MFNRAFDQGDGEWEITQAGSFRSMIECNIRCVLQEGHDPDAPALASTKDGSLHLFEDETGLGFHAEIAPDNNALMTVLPGIVSGSACRCSVNFTRWKRDTFNGTVIVSDAVIDHIAIVPQGAYASTLVWRADTDDLPYNIQQWADKWQEGYEASLTKPVVLNTRTTSHNGSDRKRAAAKAFRDSDARTLRMLGGNVNPHNGMRLTAPKNGKKPSTLSMLATVTVRVVRRLIALEEKVAEMERKQ